MEKFLNEAQRIEQLIQKLMDDVSADIKPVLMKSNGENITGDTLMKTQIFTSLCNAHIIIEQLRELS